MPGTKHDKKENKYEKYNIIEIDRKALKDAPYNPRIISEKNKEKLKENIKKIGLIEPPIYNKRTNHIVSGHQRLNILDSLNRSQDYKLRVIEIDVDEKIEIEQNIFMNNPNSQGEYDLNKLIDISNIRIDWDQTGFSTQEIIDMFGDNIDLIEQDKLVDIANGLKAMHEIRDKIKKKSDDNNKDDYYIVLVFKDSKEKKVFLKANDLPIDDTFIDGRLFLEAKKGE